MKYLYLGYTSLSILFLIFSYGFVDLNLILSTHPFFKTIHEPLRYLVFEKRGWAGGIYLIFLLGFWILYYYCLKKIEEQKISLKQIKKIILTISLIFLFSFPAFSYDIFNYILTAKVTFTYKENPWVIRPTEIPNEPALAYTRAANKWALYGPTWILLTYIPHIAGFNNVWWTIIMFKLLIVSFYLGFIYLLWQTTKNLWNVSFFALNPLVIFEILNDSHNDIVMMAMVAAALILISKKTKLSLLFMLMSIFIKGASLVLLPLYFVKKSLWSKAYWLFFGVFLISPFREEMYPWYFIWCLSCVAFLPKSKRFLYGFSLAFCFGLLLRNLPYIVTRQYEGYNQIFRTAVTWIPGLIFICYYYFHPKKGKDISPTK